MQLIIDTCYIYDAIKPKRTCIEIPLNWNNGNAKCNILSPRHCFDAAKCPSPPGSIGIIFVTCMYLYYVYVLIVVNINVCGVNNNNNIIMNDKLYYVTHNSIHGKIQGQ